MANTPLIIDVREKDEYDAEHISGSVHLPLSRIQELAPDVIRKLEGRNAILMCRSGKRAQLAKSSLEQSGLSGDLVCEIFEGGILEWKRQGHPVQTPKKGHVPIMQQVQIVVGAGVLSFSLLTAFVHPLFVIGAAFFGGGLLFAGVSGRCILAEFLGRAPWNRIHGDLTRKEVCAASPAAGICDTSNSQRSSS